MRYSVLCLLILFIGAPEAAESDRYIGFRGDGTGVFPEDCTPAPGYAWSSKTNLVWVHDFGRTANWGNNASPIVAGGKIFCVTEPIPEQSLGPMLHCIDPDDGKVIWQADCNHVDLLPKEVQQSVQEALQEHQRYFVEFDALCRDYLSTMKKLPDPKAAAHLNQLRDRAHAMDMSKVCGTKADGTLDGNGRSVYLGWVEGRYDPPRILELRKLLAEHGYYYRVDPWIMAGIGCIGYAPCTPCSDGERVYVATAFYDLFCFDLDGKLLWKVYVPCKEINGTGNFRASYFPSPILSGDLVIRYWANDSVPKDGQSVRAYDKYTGKEVWRAGKGSVSPYALGTPLSMEIDKVKLLYLADGRVLRLADGKQVADGMGFAAHGSPDAVHGDIVVASTGQEGGAYKGDKARNLPGGHLIAYRLSWTDDSHEALTVTELWRGEYGRMPIIHQGKIYSSGKQRFCVDLQTGTMVQQRGSQYIKELGTNYSFRSNHYLTIAGDHLFGSDRGVLHCVTRDGFDYIALSNDLPEEVGAISSKGALRPQYGGQMFHSGNRSFYLSNMYRPRLLCVGDPSQPTRLSALHR